VGAELAVFSALEVEMLALLWMGAEPVEELVGMFVLADEEGLRRLGGSVRVGVEMLLGQLSARQLVTCRAVTGQRWWELTALGVQAARENIDTEQTTQEE
jgi:hypothetical protein